MFSYFDGKSWWLVTCKLGPEANNVKIRGVDGVDERPLKDIDESGANMTMADWTMDNGATFCISDFLRLRWNIHHNGIMTLYTILRYYIRYDDIIYDIMISYTILWYYIWCYDIIYNIMISYMGLGWNRHHSDIIICMILYMRQKKS